MATVPMSLDQVSVPASPATASALRGAALHRIADVRRRQGISLRSAARQLGVEMREARVQESASTDLRVSDMHRWQQVLGVPMEELFTEAEAPLSRPIMERAQLLRVMKTAMALQEKAHSPAQKRLAQMLVEQLCEIMPELKQVSAWHSVGQRRSLDELGVAAERRLSDDFLSLPGRLE